MDGAVSLGCGHFKFDSCGFVIQPFGNQAGQALLFEFEIAARHAVAQAREHLSFKDPADVRGHK